MKKNNLYLLADIGGTNSNFEIYDPIKLKRIKRFDFLTKNLLNFNNFLVDFLFKLSLNDGIDLKKAIFAVAGEIKRKDELVIMSNQNIIIDVNEIKFLTSLEYIYLINDFTSLSSSLFELNSSDVYILRGDNFLELKSNLERKKILVVGAGTGLGVSYIKYGNIIESEDGHTLIPRKIEMDKSLINFLKKNLSKKNIEFEDIVSGRGLENIYFYLSYGKENLSAEDISKTYFTNNISKKTFNLFFKYYFEFIKFISNSFKPDIVFIAGGIIEKNLNILIENYELLYYLKEKIFNDNILKNTPFIIVKDYNCSLIGLERLARLNYNKN